MKKGRKQAIDGGYTGKIREVNSKFIKSLLDQGLTPVISPIAMSEESEFLNVDGDRAAAYVAGKDRMWTKYYSLQMLTDY